MYSDTLLDEESDVSTEFISLTRFMHESKMFDIVSKIDFFKNFTTGKIFKIWRLNVRYRLYCQTRKKLIREVYFAKPRFAPELLEINKLTYDFQNAQTVFVAQNKSWDPEEFKSDQKKVKQDAGKTYDAIVEKIMVIVESLVRKMKDIKIDNPNEIDEAQLGKPTKAKPMVQIKKEEQERKLRLKLARLDQSMLGNMVRLVDYMILENLVKMNHVSMDTLSREIHSQERKSGMFKISVQFGHQKDEMTFSPGQDEIVNLFKNILEEMVKTMGKVTRMEGNVVDDLIRHIRRPDIQQIILQSREYNHFRTKILDKVEQDFEDSNRYVVANYEKCRDVNEYHQRWNKEDFVREPHTFLELKAEFEKLVQYKRMMKASIRDHTEGILYLDGPALNKRLMQSVNQALEEVKSLSYKMMKEKAAETNKNFSNAVVSLEKDPKTLSAYAEFIESLNDAIENKPKLEEAKREVEEMHVLLKRMEDTQKILTTNDAVTLEEIQNESKKLEELIISASELKRNKKEEMVQSLDKNKETLSERIKGTIETIITSEKLTSDQTPIKDAMRELDNLKAQIERAKEQNKTYNHYTTVIISRFMMKSNIFSHSLAYD